MTASRRVRTALLRLAAPFRRRHPIVLGGPTATETARLRVAILPTGSGTTTMTDDIDYYVVERDPSDEAGA